MATRHNSRNSRNSGFIPLGGGPQGEMADSGDIPLTAVRSNASTGNRKPNMANVSGVDSWQQGSENEKTHNHLHHRLGGRRRKTPDQKIGRKDSGDGEGASLNLMGKIYARIMGFSVVSRYLVYIVPVALALAVPIIVLPIVGDKDDIPVGSQKNDNGKTIDGPPLFDIFLWIEISWLSLWAGKVVAWLLPKAFMFVCGIVSAGTRKYATVLSNVKITLSLFFWALATWISFVRIFHDAKKRGIDWVDDVERVFGSIFVASAVLLVEKAIVQLIGVSYHQRSFDLRIKASKREIHLLGLLYDASRTLFPMYCKEFEEEDYVIDDSIELKIGPKGRKVINPMKVIGDVGRVGGKVTSAFGTMTSEITGKKVFNPNSAHSIIISALEKLGPTEALARRIWMSFVVEDKDALYVDDFQEVLGPAYRDEAEEAFNAIDGDMNGDISLDEMVRKTVEMGKERKAIAEGMKDIGQALRAFDSILMFVWLLIVIFIFLAFFQSSFVNVIASAGTALLSLSFIFAVTAQEFLGSCIFLFVKHPYDVGDRVDVTGAQMIVERISLLYSVFTRLDTNQTVQIPNIVLNNLWVDNVTRSKAMVENIALEVSFDTSFEDVELLRAEMEQFVRDPENTRDFQRDFSIGIDGVGSLDKLLLGVSIKHKSNWHNGAVRATRRSKFMCALALALKKIPIYGPGGGGDPLGAPSNPSYSVAVSDDFASRSRDDAATAKAKARLVPPPEYSTQEEALAAEQQAVTGINNRPPVIETSGLWDNSDAKTVASQDDRQDVASIRSSLHKQDSQRGRRRAGESIQSLSPTESNYRSPFAGGQRLETFDEEAATGMPSSFYAQNHEETASGHLAPSGSVRQGLRHSFSQRSRVPAPPPPGGR